MRTYVVLLSVLAIVVIVAPPASAQAVVARGAAAAPLTAPAVAPGYVLVPYSYWAAIPYPARGYVGYGSNDFPYYGRPYGSPSDPWTWPYMSGSYQSYLARYYYPPVR